MTQDGPSAPRIVALALAAALIHLAADWASLHVPGAAPPHLRLEYAPEVFQTIPWLAVSIASSAVNGIIAAIALVALDSVAPQQPARPSAPRWPLLGGVLFGFWVLSDGLMALVWLSLPAGAALAGLGAGLPRCLAVGYALATLGSSRPARVVPRG